MLTANAAPGFSTGVRILHRLLNTMHHAHLPEGLVYLESSAPNDQLSLSEQVPHRLDRPAQRDARMGCPLLQVKEKYQRSAEHGATAKGNNATTLNREPGFDTRGMYQVQHEIGFGVSTWHG